MEIEPGLLQKKWLAIRSNTASDEMLTIIGPLAIDAPLHRSMMKCSPDLLQDDVCVP